MKLDKKKGILFWITGLSGAGKTSISVSKILIRVLCKTSISQVSHRSARLAVPRLFPVDVAVVLTRHRSNAELWGLCVNCWTCWISLCLGEVMNQYAQGRGDESVREGPGWWISTRRVADFSVPAGLPSGHALYALMVASTPFNCFRARAVAIPFPKFSIKRSFRGAAPGGCSN